MSKEFTKQNVIDIVQSVRDLYNGSGYQSETPIDEILQKIKELV